MRAEEALAITKANKKSIQDLIHTIESMAKNGYQFAAWEPKDVQEEQIIELEALGYKVSIGVNNIKAEW